MKREIYVPDADRSMDTRLRSLFDEQQLLIANLRKRMTLLGGSEIFVEAILAMRVIEGVIADRPGTEVFANDFDKASAVAETLLLRLQSGEEGILDLAVDLSAELASLVENSWGAKMTRIMVLGAYLGFELHRADRTCAMCAVSSAKKVWSDLRALAAEEQRRQQH